MENNSRFRRLFLHTLEVVSFPDPKPLSSCSVEGGSGAETNMEGDVDQARLKIQLLMIPDMLLMGVSRK